MKRAIYIVVAALLVLLVYPSTHPSAKAPNPGTVVGPTVVTPVTDGGPATYSDNDDSGDSDDVAGHRNGDDTPDGSLPLGSASSPTEFGFVFKMWWNFMIWIR